MRGNWIGPLRKLLLHGFVGIGDEEGVVSIFDMRTDSVRRFSFLSK